MEEKGLGGREGEQRAGWWEVEGGREGGVGREGKQTAHLGGDRALHE